ncbi:winged helix-turn-helix transcriptional regulator [Streptomyces nondiastaticus]|uniref:Winged helix-turn-helix transcriptional regulator n=1 Tax=Streptomyces nondiastaticus TaxID=3154512 RepID=A0ABW6U6Y2_9ACTN
MTHRTESRGAAAPRPGLPDAPLAAVTEPTPGCPVEITLDALRGRWTTLVVRELLRGPGPRSYSELAAALPALSDKVLADRLAHLVDRGVAERIRTAGWPPAVRYELSPRGRALGPVLQALWDWGEGASPQPPGGSSGGPSRGSSQGSPRQPAEW